MDGLHFRVYSPRYYCKKRFYKSSFCTDQSSVFARPLSHHYTLVAGLKESDARHVMRIRTVDPDPHSFSLLDPEKTENERKLVLIGSKFVSGPWFSSFEQSVLSFSTPENSSWCK